MANIQGQKKWSDVRLLETHELARGGVNGNLNEQAIALADRTEFLNQEKASKSEIVQGVFEFGTYAEFNAVKATLPTNCTVVIGESNTTGAGQWGLGNNRWNGSVLSKSSFDPFTKSQQYSDDLVKLLNKGIPVGRYSEQLISQATISDYLTSSGILSSGVDQNWLTTDYIALSGATSIDVVLVAVSAMRSVCFYDDSKVFISSSPAVSSSTATVYTGVLEIPVNAKYLRFTKATSSLPETTPEQINDQSIIINGVGEAYIEKIAADVDVLKAGNFPTESDLLPLLSNSGYINASGTVTNDPNFKNTDFIAAKAGDVIQIKLIAHTLVSSIAFYDANKTLLTKVLGTSANQILTTELTAPANTAYVRVSGAIVVVDAITLPDPYAKKLSVVNVTSEIENLKSGASNKQEYQLLAPSAVYTTCNDVGSATNKGRLRNYSASIYLDHMLNGLTSEKHIRFKDAVDKFTFVAPMVVTDSNENTPAVTLNNGVNANEATTAITVQGNDIVAATVNVKHRSALNSVTASAFPKVLCIGDSITYGEMATLPDDGFAQNHAYHLIAKELFMKDKIDNGNSGFDCLFLGTKSKTKTASYAGNTLTVNTKHEGVRGRSLAQHLDGTDATFWDSVNSKFSINAWLSKYRTLDDSGNRLAVGAGTGSLINAGNRDAYDVCTPTHVLIALGMNNGGTLAQFQSMINSIRTELPNAIIGIAVPDAAGTYFPSLHPNCSKECTIWNDTGAQGSRKNQQYNLLKTLQDYYGTSYESQNIYMVPFYHTAPTAESVAFRKADQLDAEYSSILESDFRQHYGWHASTHTNALGHINWGYQLYSWIKWTIAKKI